MNGNILEETEVKELLESVLKKFNIKGDKYEISEGKKKGDGYLSCITKVDISDQNADKILHVMIKCAPKNEDFRKMTPLHNIYKNEIQFYDEIWPVFKQFQEDNGLTEDQVFKAISKCYKTSCEEGDEYLIFQNIREKGFDLWNRLLPMDDDHIKLVVREYGKFHALSYALKEQKPDEYNKLIHKVTPIFTRESIDENFKQAMSFSLSIIKQYFEPEEDIYHEIEKIELNVIDIMDSLHNLERKYGVINHGDCWCNNMMFKYNSDGKPKEVCLLDFQIIRVGSPVLDLAYFFYVSCDADAISNLDNYLLMYLDSLKEHMHALGCKHDEDTLTFDVLKSEWKEFSKFGFIMAAMILRAILSEGDEVMDIDDMDLSMGKEGMHEFINKKRKNDDVIKKRLMDLALHLHENKYF